MYKYNNTTSGNSTNNSDYNKTLIPITKKEEEIEELKLKDETLELMKKNYSYPEQSDPNIQYKLFKKREYYYNKIPERPDIKDDIDYSVIKNYRDEICGATSFTLHPQQAMLSNFINPNTPYKGILIFHGLGTGKCIGKNSKVNINNIDVYISDIWEKYATYTYIDDENGIWSVPSDTLYVNSFNTKTNTIIKKQVKHLYREKVSTILRKITLLNKSTVIITDIHKLYVNGEWNNNILVDDNITTFDNNNLSVSTVINIELVKYNDYIYDLEIEDTHNYIAEGIVCHNTIGGVAIAEKFKPLVQKYNTKIHILVPGPLLKESWKNDIIKATGDTYNNQPIDVINNDKFEKIIQRKRAIEQLQQYYRIISYRGFYKKVLGERITDTDISSTDTKKTTYRKTKDGDFERDISIDRIYNLDNSLIIVDEAHNLTGSGASVNNFGEALKKIISVSKNLKIVLLTATPMKNLGDDIIELINFIRPADSPMMRDKIFNSHKNSLMDFKKGGLDYLKNMINGYVSHVRGSDPLTFAKRVDKGIIPKGLMFTPLIKCHMLEFQRKIYDKTVEESDDALDRKSSAVSNMCFPGLSSDKKSITGYFGNDGLNTIKEQLKTSQELLNKKIGEKFFNGKTDEYMYLSGDNKTVAGKIYKKENLKVFSIKFYKALKKINRLVAGKKGAKSAFIYSNLVKVGVDTFKEILLQNGYLEFQENRENYIIDDDTLCYYCGNKHKNHAKLNRLYRANDGERFDGGAHKSGSGAQRYTSDSGAQRYTSDPITSDSGSNSETDKKYKNIRISDSSTEYSEKQKANFNNIKPHNFYPGTFITITGKATDDSVELLQEDKKRILDDVFNNINNKDGKYIKFVLGSKVMNEGISLKNVGEVHILDVYYNLGMVDQVVGRAIRWCSHYKLMGENNVFPYVNVYKYVVSLNKKNNGELSTDEILYKKAEQKYILIKKIERALRERAIDCPLNLYGNIFPEEVRKYEKCDIHGELKCPAICDYTKCAYNCDNVKLNYEYYDPKRKIYRLLKKDELDMSTFTKDFAKYEIEYAKNIIKNMYILYPVYTIEDILKYVKKMYAPEKRDLLDKYFVYRALDDLMPFTQNEFNNFRDVVVDKNNTQGYIIHRNKYYIFQPFSQNEDIPMYYRIHNTDYKNNQLPLSSYLKTLDKYKQLKGITDESDMSSDVYSNNKIYNFDDTYDYYDSRPEYDIVGIIDKELSRRKNKRLDELKDVFKIRPKLTKNDDKKRGTGIHSITGAVCATSKAKSYLLKIAKKLGLNTKNISTRDDICNILRDEFLLREKYATDKDKNKFTYIRIPSNHPKYPFPYNLEDRVKSIIDKIKKEIKYSVDISTSVEISKDTKLPVYYIYIKDTPKLKHYYSYLETLQGVQDAKNTRWVIGCR